MTSIILHNLLSFIFIISIIVFIHEFGHYYIARICGVKIEQFSIGFGREIFGFNDKNQTRWKFCLIPFGGYVKMFGDKNPASMPDGKVKKFTKKEKEVSFYYQNIYKRILIVLSGPIANFILAIMLFAVIFKINGIQTTLPIISKISPNSPAYEAGLLPNDRILQINNKKINDFSQIKQFVALNGHNKLNFTIKRQDKIIEIIIEPKIRQQKNVFENNVESYFIGIESDKITKQELGILLSLQNSVIKTYELSGNILTALSHLVTGEKSVKDLGGPIKIAKYSGKSIDMGWVVTLYFIAIISINLGVINLLPIPTLDGGHLFFYLIELIRGKALPEKIQEYSFRVGISFVIGLMLFTIFNDIIQSIN